MLMSENNLCPTEGKKITSLKWFSLHFSKSHSFTDTRNFCQKTAEIIPERNRIKRQKYYLKLGHGKLEAEVLLGSLDVICLYFLSFLFFLGFFLQLFLKTESPDNLLNYLNISKANKQIYTQHYLRN